jgi:hypothetical protein
MIPLFFQPWESLLTHLFIIALRIYVPMTGSPPPGNNYRVLVPSCSLLVFDYLVRLRDAHLFPRGGFSSLKGLDVVIGIHNITRNTVGVT